MSLAVHALATTPGHLRVWVGADGPRHDQDLRWRLNGIGVRPEAIRPLQPVAAWAPGVTTWSGIYEIGPDGVTAERQRLEVQDPRDQQWTALDTRPLPSALPTGLGGRFRVLLVSCYSQLADKVGYAGNLVKRRLSGVDAPDLVLTVGDQVYLDSPPNYRAPYHAEELAQVFERTYLSTWTGAGYADILRSGPVAGIPDDHEYWNNFPQRGFLSSTTLLPGGSDNWRRAARAMYDGFQLGGPDRYSFRIDVPPLSFFLLDNRTFREGKVSTRRADLDAFRAWTDDVAADHLIPVIVTGPSLLQPAKGFLGGLLDRNLANHDDYPEIIRRLTGLADAGTHVVALTGDVHYGRVTDGSYPVPRGHGLGVGRLTEVVSSPSSLVKPLSHRAAQPVDGGFAPRGSDRRFSWTTPYPRNPAQQGNHVALLTFTGTPFGADLDITYWMVPRSGDLADVTHAVPTIPLHRGSP